MNYPLLSHINKDSGPILIIGHSGFKGTWLSIFLEHFGVEVIGLSLPPEPESLFDRANRSGKIQEEFFDIRDEIKVKEFITRIKPRAIIHLAAQSLVLDSYDNPKHTFDVNVFGLTNVLNAVSQIDSIEVTLVTTTDKVYKNIGSGKAFIESDPLQGKDPYSASKVAAENAIFAWRELLRMQNNTKILTARAGNVIGGGDFSKHRLIPDLVRAFSTESNLEIRNPSSTRPWQHVLDPLTGYLAMVNSAFNGSKIEVLNFGPTERSLSVQDVVKIASKEWQTEAKITYSNNVDNMEAKSLELDSSSARDNLGWKPVWNQSEAIVKSVAWWKDVLSKNIDAESRCILDIIDYTSKMGI